MRRLVALTLAGLTAALLVALITVTVSGDEPAAAPAGTEATASIISAQTETSGSNAATDAPDAPASGPAGAAAHPETDEHADGHREDPPARDDGLRVTVWPAGSTTQAQARTLGLRAWEQLDADLRDSGQRTWSAWRLDAIRVDTSPADGPYVHLSWTATRSVDGREDVQTTRWPWRYGGLDGR